MDSAATRKQGWLRMAEEAAADFAGDVSELRKAARVYLQGGDANALLAVLKSLHPSRSGRSRENWEAVRRTLTPLVERFRGDRDALLYVLGWLGRLAGSAPRPPGGRSAQPGEWSSAPAPVPPRPEQPGPSAGKKEKRRQPPSENPFAKLRDYKP